MRSSAVTDTNNATKGWLLTCVVLPTLTFVVGAFLTSGSASEEKADRSVKAVEDPAPLSDEERKRWKDVKVLLPRSHFDDRLKIRFTHPGEFGVGAFDAKHDSTGFFSGALVLVEDKILGDHDLHNIPIGKLPTISLRSFSGVSANYWRELCDVQKWRVKIGAHEVVKLPGFPGPFGDEASFYMLPRADGTVILIFAAKHYLKGDRCLTRYDWAIELIIATMEFTK